MPSNHHLEVISAANATCPDLGIACFVCAYGAVVARGCYGKRNFFSLNVAESEMTNRMADKLRLTNMESRHELFNWII